MSDNLAELKEAEARFFDKQTQRRMDEGRIPIEADIRRATPSKPRWFGDELIDPKMTFLLEGAHRDRFIALASHAPGGRVLDICCGPGWLSLELARNGQTVDAYDLSHEAIALARRMLAENPYQEGFGGINYHVGDVTKVDLGVEQYDAVTGSSAFHHIDDLRAFMETIYRALKPGGIIVTVDDMPRGALEIALDRFFRLILPTYNMSYWAKLKAIVKRAVGITRTAEEIFSPMEQGKHDSVYVIAEIWHRDFEIVEEAEFMAFSLSPCTLVKGPDAFRYQAARLIIAIDKLLCRLGLTRGFIRVIVGRKPLPQAS
jgi:2-polyprenyl-3-methyl-5-hydroxy-6-metoxy-1,4-benzoquinol methylase